MPRESLMHQPGRPREPSQDICVSVVAPVYNERALVDEFVAEVLRALEKLALPGAREVVLVDDGSWDGSGEALDAWVEQSGGVVRVVHLARNFGHAAAVTAGLEHARGDVVILMDADLQDDPAAFGAFVERWLQGFDVVYAERTNRRENPVMRLLFWGFYRAFVWIANIGAPLDAGNFALMDRRVVKQLLALSERNRYLPGLRAWVGFRQCGVPVPRRARPGGRGRVGLRGLWTLGMNAIFSFSYVPLFVFRIAGVVSVGLAGLLLLFALYAAFIAGTGVQPWVAQLAVTAFLGGINLFGIGFLGEYIARIYDEVKGRPIFVVERIEGCE